MNEIEVVLKDGGTHIIKSEQLEYWKMLYPDLDINSEIGYLKEMWTVEAIPRRTAKNINKYINRWLYKQSIEDL